MYMYYYADEEVARKDPKYRLKTINAETRDVLETLEKEYKAPVGCGHVTHYLVR